MPDADTAILFDFVIDPRTPDDDAAFVALSIDIAHRLSKLLAPFRDKDLSEEDQDKVLQELWSYYAEEVNSSISDLGASAFIRTLLGEDVRAVDGETILDGLRRFLDWIRQNDTVTIRESGFRVERFLRSLKWKVSRRPPTARLEAERAWLAQRLDIANRMVELIQQDAYSEHTAERKKLKWKRLRDTIQEAYHIVESELSGHEREE